MLEKQPLNFYLAGKDETLDKSIRYADFVFDYSSNLPTPNEVNRHLRSWFSPRFFYVVYIVIKRSKKSKGFVTYRVNWIPGPSAEDILKSINAMEKIETPGKLSKA